MNLVLGVGVVTTYATMVCVCVCMFGRCSTDHKFAERERSAGQRPRPSSCSCFTSFKNVPSSENQASDLQQSHQLLEHDHTAVVAHLKQAVPTLSRDRICAALIDRITSRDGGTFSCPLVTKRKYRSRSPPLPRNSTPHAIPLGQQGFVGRANSPLRSDARCSLV